MIAVSASSVRTKVGSFQKRRFHLTHLHQSAPGKHRNAATVASLWKYCADLTGPGIEPRPSAPIACALTTKLMADTGPEIESKTFRADYDVVKHYANWPV